MKTPEEKKAEILLSMEKELENFPTEKECLTQWYNKLHRLALDYKEQNELPPTNPLQNL